MSSIFMINLHGHDVSRRYACSFDTIFIVNGTQEEVIGHVKKIIIDKWNEGGDFYINNYFDHEIQNGTELEDWINTNAVPELNETKSIKFHAMCKECRIEIKDFGPDAFSSGITPLGKFGYSYE